jgi:ABC-type transport system substrate-binding protein
MSAHRLNRLTAALVIVSVAASLLASCAGQESPAAEGPAIVEIPQHRGGRLVYGLESDPNGLDPTRNAWDNAGLQLANALYDPLVAFDTEGQSKPYLAESITPGPDFRSWTIKLRPGIAFHGGAPLDAAALVTYFEALRNSAITGPPAQLITGVRAVGELTVELVTRAPWASLPALLAGQGGYVVSPAQLGSEEGTSHPDGTGPFVLKHWDVDQRFSLARNPRYWRSGMPYLDAVDFVVVNQGRQRVEMLERGDLDATALTSPWDLAALDETLARPQGAHLRVEQDHGDAEKNSVMFNNSKAPFNDVRVRRAMAYATDIEAIARANQWPLDRLAAGPLDPTSKYFTAAPYPTYDPNKARELIRQYLSDTTVKDRPRGINFTFLAAEMNSKLVDDLVAQWAKVGVRAKVSLVDPKQIVRFAVLGDYDAMILRYFASVDPDVLWHFFVSETIASSGISLNFARLDNKTITNGMNFARATPEVGVRKAAYANVQAEFAEQMPFLWLNRSEWRVATVDHVRDAHNVTLPDGSAALPLVAGTHRLTETWLDK